jgi:hypothetical protein
MPRRHPLDGPAVIARYPPAERHADINRRIENGRLTLFEKRLAAILVVIDLRPSPGFRQDLEVMHVGAEEPTRVVVMQEKAGANPFHRQQQQPKAEKSEE